MNAMLGVLVSSGGLINLLVSILVVALVFWLIWWVIGWMKLPEPIGLIVRVVIGIIAILVLLRLIGIF